MSDILQVQGINSKGFGVIPKLVMQDKRLTPQAKAIYAYFCSYAGAGRTVFPSRSKIIVDLGISKDSYYKHLNLLKNCGYIRAEQENKNGKFQRNIFTLLETLPCPELSDTVKTVVPCPKSPCTEIPCTENTDTNNNIIKNKQSFINISQSSQSEKSGQDKDPTDDTERKIQSYEWLIKENISYEDLAQSRRYDMGLVNEFITIIIDVLMSEGKTVRIGGEDKPRALVRSQLLKLDYNDIEHAIDQFKGVTERITKKKQYILTMLYNCKMEMDSHYTNAVISDRYQ